MKRWVTAGIAGMAMGGTVSAAPILTEDFAYTAGNIDTKNGGDGWSAAWSSSGGTTVLANATDLAFTQAGYDIVQTAGSGSIGPAYVDYRQAHRATPTLSGEVWFSFLMRHDNVAGDYLLRFSFNAPAANAGNSNSWFQLTGSTFSYRFSDTASASVTANVTGSFAKGQTHLIVGRALIGAGNDTLSMWIDPDDLTHGVSGLGAADVSGSGIDGFGSSLTRIGIGGRGTDSSSPYTTDQIIARFDAFRVGVGTGGFYDVVPEPASMALLLAAGALLVRRRNAPVRR